MLWYTANVLTGAAARQEVHQEELHQRAADNSDPGQVGVAHSILVMLHTSRWLTMLKSSCCNRNAN